MSYVGKWMFHSIGTVDDETLERVWLNAEEYMNAPMLYSDEIKERKKTVGMILEVCENGKLYALMPLPENVSKEEVEAAVKAGAIKVRDGMMTDDPFVWQERDGELWGNMGLGNEFQQFSGDGDLLTMVTTRFEKLQ